MLPLLKKEAKERQEAHLKRGNVRPLEPIGPNGEVNGKHGKSTDIAADAVQVGSSSIGRARVV